MIASRLPTVEFFGVGRDKHSWTQFMRVSDESLIRAIRKMRVLMSRDIDVEINDDGTGGLVFAGIRTVGSFTIKA